MQPNAPTKTHSSHSGCGMHTRPLSSERHESLGTGSPAGCTGAVSKLAVVTSYRRGGVREQASHTWAALGRRRSKNYQSPEAARDIHTNKSVRRCVVVTKRLQNQKDAELGNYSTDRIFVHTQPFLYRRCVDPPPRI